MLSPSWLLLVTGIIGVPLLAVGLFVRWIGRQTHLTFDEKTRAWGVLTALLGSLTVIGGGALVVAKYADEQAQFRHSELQARERDRSQRERQVAGQDATRLQAEHDRLQRLYDATMAAATRLRALAPDDLQTLRNGQARLEYEDLYWARLIGLESEGVELAMADFRKLLVAWEQDAVKPNRLNEALLHLATACQEHLKSYQVRIVDLRRREVGLVAEAVPASR